MTVSPKLGVVGISTLWHFRLPLPLQMFIKVASSPRLSGIGMPSPILWSHPLKMQRIVLLSSLLWWELGTNSLITGHGEWLSFRRFTSKLSWSWSWSWLLWLNEGKTERKWEREINDWTNEQSNKRTNEWMNNLTNEDKNGWKKQRTINKLMNEKQKERKWEKEINDGTNERTNKQMDKHTNAWMNEW